MKTYVSAVVCLVLIEMVWGVDEATVDSSLLPWAEARQSCQSRGPTCDLTVQRIEQREFWESLYLNIGNKYWVGAKRLSRMLWSTNRTPLVMEQGCYEAQGFRTSMSRRLRYNGPERCLALCDGSYVALQNMTCHCLDPSELPSFAARPPEECHIHCTREPYLCGGGNSRLSVYKLPDRSLFQREGRSERFFWMRTHTNQNEMILFTNKPTSKTAYFCVSSSGQYLVPDPGYTCPAGYSDVSFENIDLMEFLDQTSSLTDFNGVSFWLPLAPGWDLLWLDGEKVGSASSRGPCIAITYDGQHFSLERISCRRKLPSVCSCYTPSQTTESTLALMLNATFTQPHMSDTTTLAEETHSSAEMSTMFAEETTSSSEEMPTTFSAETPSSVDVPTAPAAETTTLTIEIVDTTLNVTSEEEGLDTTETDLSLSGTTALPVDVEIGQERDENSTLLFPFHDVNESGSPSYLERPGKSQSDDDRPVTSASSEMIIGVSLAGVAVLVVVVVVVVILIQKRRKRSPNSLLNKPSAASRATNYPI